MQETRKIQRVSPNSITALGFYCCISASVCVCVCVCQSVLLRKELSFVVVHNVSRTSSCNVFSGFRLSSKKIAEMIPYHKKCFGSRPRASWGALGAEHASRLEKQKHKIGLPRLFGTLLAGYLEKKSSDFPVFFEAVSRPVFSQFLVNFRCMFLTFVMVVGK